MIFSIHHNYGRTLCICKHLPKDGCQFIVSLPVQRREPLVCLMCISDIGVAACFAVSSRPPRYCVLPRQEVTHFSLALRALDDVVHRPPRYTHELTSVCVIALSFTRNLVSSSVIFNANPYSSSTVSMVPRFQSKSAPEDDGLSPQRRAPPPPLRAVRGRSSRVSGFPPSGRTSNLEGVYTK